MSELETKQAIIASLKGFADKPLVAAATALFESLGYYYTRYTVDYQRVTEVANSRCQRELRSQCHGEPEAAGEFCHGCGDCRDA
ncbi:MAG: hypothetical protein ACLQU4_08580 [Limisphaerales bacterium]